MKKNLALEISKKKREGFHRVELSFSNFLKIKESLITGKEIRIKISGKSMTPLVREGDFISVTMTHVKDIKRYDVIVYWRNGILICHYFWKLNINNGTFHSRALNPLTNIDPPVCCTQILGKVEACKINYLFKMKIFFFTFLCKK